MVSLSVPWAVTTGETLFIAWALTLAAPSFLVAFIFTLGVTIALISAELVVISTTSHAVGDFLLPQDFTVWTGVRSNWWEIMAPVWVSWLILCWAPAFFIIAEGKIWIVNVAIVIS